MPEAPVNKQSHPLDWKYKIWLSKDFRLSPPSLYPTLFKDRN
jgi:hypothetical protein